MTYTVTDTFDVTEAEQRPECDTCHRLIQGDITEVEYRSTVTHKRIAKIDWLCEDCAKGLESTHR